MSQVGVQKNCLILNEIDIRRKYRTFCSISCHSHSARL